MCVMRVFHKLIFSSPHTCMQRATLLTAGRGQKPDRCLLKEQSAPAGHFHLSSPGCWVVCTAGQQPSSFTSHSTAFPTTSRMPSTHWPTGQLPPKAARLPPASCRAWGCTVLILPFEVQKTLHSPFCVKSSECLKKALLLRSTAPLLSSTTPGLSQAMRRCLPPSLVAIPLLEASFLCPWPG